MREQGLSLVDLDRILRRMKLTPPTRANPHVRVQHSPVWEMAFDRIVTLNIDEVPLDASLNAVEDALGLARTDFDRLPAFAHLHETHYAKEGVFDPAVPIETYRFRRTETDAFPKRQLAASLYLDDMARRLYRSDYGGVGTSDTKGALFRPDAATTPRRPAAKERPVPQLVPQPVPQPVAERADSGGKAGTRSPGRLAIAAIFKNEGPYVHEWIAHHRALGIERFFIADNTSTDETTATLAALAAAGIVDHLPFPTPPGRGPQQAAYEKILNRHTAARPTGSPSSTATSSWCRRGPHRTLSEVIAALDPAAGRRVDRGELGGLRLLRPPGGRDRAGGRALHPARRRGPSGQPPLQDRSSAPAPTRARSRTPTTCR